MPFFLARMPVRHTMVGMVAAGTGIAAAAAVSWQHRSTIHQAALSESEGGEVKETILTSSTVDSAKPSIAIGPEWLLMKGALWGMPKMIWLGALFGAEVNKAYSATFNDDLMFFENDGSAYTPLVAACITGNTEAVDELLLVGADVNCADTWIADVPMAQPALYLAVQYQKKAIAYKLFKKNAKVDAITAAGKTALFAAAENNDVEMVRLLLKWGADCTIADHYGVTAAVAAKEAKASKALKALRVAQSANNAAGSGDVQAAEKAALAPKRITVTKRVWVETEKETASMKTKKGTTVALATGEAGEAGDAGDAAAARRGGEGRFAGISEGGLPIWSVVAIGAGGIGIGVTVAVALLGNK